MAREEIENVWVWWGLDLVVENEKGVQKDEPTLTGALLNQKNLAN